MKKNFKLVSGLLSIFLCSFCAIESTNAKKMYNNSELKVVKAEDFSISSRKLDICNTGSFSIDGIKDTKDEITLYSEKDDSPIKVKLTSESRDEFVARIGGVRFVELRHIKGNVTPVNKSKLLACLSPLVKDKDYLGKLTKILNSENIWVFAISPSLGTGPVWLDLYYVDSWRHRDLYQKISEMELPHISTGEFERFKLDNTTSTDRLNNCGADDDYDDYKFGKLVLAEGKKGIFIVKDTSYRLE